MREEDLHPKRVFFGCQVEAPWPETYPSGRWVPEEGRHITLAFLGEVPFSQLQKDLKQFPPIPFLLSPCGVFDRCVFLPTSQHPRVVAWHVTWTGEDVLSSFQRTLSLWLKGLGYDIEVRAFLPHVTVARAPFSEEDWQKVFYPLPVKVRSIRLVESHPGLIYTLLWETLCVPAFEEREHTADRAFVIRGTQMADMLTHAELALAFLFPPLLRYRCQNPHALTTQEAVVSALNDMIAHADIEMGCPLKAVSYAGDIMVTQEGLQEWEMICDV